MTELRTGRRTYYNWFSHVYDGFVRLHARGESEGTREFLVRNAALPANAAGRILDICCGTGAVIHALARSYAGSLAVGCDFSRGMLQRARKRTGETGAVFVEGDAAVLPFRDEQFDVVTCSHALYELKGSAREAALLEMRRVVRPTGVVLIMEHEVPRRPFVRFLFHLRMRAMGSKDAREFMGGGLTPFERVFPYVSLDHTPTGKSRLVRCRKSKES
ncbi:MAG: class I SAM-dependent methyltransferase [Desulfobacteraceae bacterium]|jgi:ubiquinone/menaquinone biosynthesis C-methylase UbiE